MYFIILLETYDWASASPLYCDGASALFYWCESIASAPEAERLPIKPQPSSSAGFGPLQQFFRMLAKFFNLTVHLLPQFPHGKTEGMHSVSALLPNAWAKTLEATVSEWGRQFLRRVHARFPSWRRLTHSTIASRGPPRGFVQAQGWYAWNWTT